MTSDDRELTLKSLIDAANTTQRELSKRIGIGETTINSWVGGRKVPRLDNAIALARELKVSLKTLARFMGLDVTDLPDDIFVPIPGSIDPATWDIRTLSHITGIKERRLEQLQGKKGIPTGEELIRLAQALDVPVIRLAALWADA